MRHILGVPHLGRLSLALPTILDKLERLEGTNAIAYCENLSITDVKSFIILTPERKTLAETENVTGKNAPKAK